MLLLSYSFQAQHPLDGILVAKYVGLENIYDPFSHYNTPLTPLELCHTTILTSLELSHTFFLAVVVVLISSTAPTKWHIVAKYVRLENIYVHFLYT